MSIQTSSDSPTASIEIISLEVLNFKTSDVMLGPSEGGDWMYRDPLGDLNLIGIFGGLAALIFMAVHD
jgi:hypothetical protein